MIRIMEYPTDRADVQRKLRYWWRMKERANTTAEAQRINQFLNRLYDLESRS